MVCVFLPVAGTTRAVIWASLLLACGGLAEDGRPLDPELSTVDAERAARRPGALRSGGEEQSREQTLPAEHAEAAAGGGPIGEPCGALEENTESVVVGTVELRKAPQCGAASWCLLRAPAVEACRSSVTFDDACATDDVVPVPPPRAPIPDWRENVCTCRCDAEETDVDLCSCPHGMRCAPLIPSAGVNAAARRYLGSYCIY